MDADLKENFRITLNRVCLLQPLYRKEEGGKKGRPE
jgi:hypothetical protein